MAGRPRIALCLTGGGATGAMYQIGALAALEDAILGLETSALDLFLGSNSGASVATMLAAGRSPERLYRAFLDPADTYFPLERKHILKMDLVEWRRAVVSILQAVRHGTTSLFSRGPAPTPAALWEELDRLYDTLPAGLFSLDAYERFLEDFFVRRGIPNTFHGMPKPLRILAHDLDSGAPVLFGSERFDHVPVSRACIASMAVPPFFSPVRIGGRYYIDAGGQVALLDAALAERVDVLVVVNAMVPVAAEEVPTGHGQKSSVRDKGLMWVMNQSMRIGIHRLLEESVAGLRAAGVHVFCIEPEPTDAMLFMYNPASFAARRKILEHAYRTTRARIGGWFEAKEPGLDRAGWQQAKGA